MMCYNYGHWPSTHISVISLIVRSKKIHQTNNIKPQKIVCHRKKNIARGKKVYHTNNIKPQETISHRKKGRSHQFIHMNCKMIIVIDYPQ